MIYGGNATVYVSDMERSIRFYTEVLGLPLTNRFGNHWATVQAGTSLVIGLHPTTEGSPAPGTKGAVQLGLHVSREVPLADLAAHLRTHGVQVTEKLNTESGDYLLFEDPDGNPIYVGDWHPDFDARPGESVEQRLARQEEEVSSAHAQG